jgi:Flp pilus assembly protein TadG
MRPLCWRNLKAAWKRFHGDQSGLALIYVTAALPVLIGFSLLAIDVGRLSSLQSSLQHGADALALAGAGELDRTPTAIDRANLAIDTLITTNESLFEDATGVVTITGTDITRHYLDQIPANDADPIDAAYLTAHETAVGQDVRFVQVIVDPKNFSTIFPVTFLGGSSNSAQSSAEAVAGRDQATCVYTPMFMCNPLEPSGNTDIYRTDELTAHVASRAEFRRLIELKKHSGGNAQWSPGNFGYLDVPLGNGANALGEAIASGYPSSCLIQNTVSTKPGNTTVSMNAFNVRFDLYKGSYSKSNSNYWPAKNVRKTYKPGNGQPSSCNIDPVDPVTDHTFSFGFPRDSCSLTDTCTLGNGRMGGGDWHGEFNAYWTYNHSGVATPVDENGTSFSDGNLPSRYEIYQAEIALGISAGAPSYANPGCYTGAAAPTSSPDRRVLYTAILNCTAQPIGSGAATGLVPVAYGKFFITEPMDGSQSSLWTELIGIEEPGEDNGKYPELVQLYR